MKNLLIVCALLAAGTLRAVNWNSQDAKAIDASVNTRSVEQKYIAAGLKAMIGKDPGNINYETFKKEWMAAVATMKEKSKYYEWYVVYAVPQAIYSIQRFRPFAKDVINDPDYKDGSFVNGRFLAEYPEFFDAAQWRIKALAALSRNDYVLSRKIFNGYRKMMKNYSAEEVNSDLEMIKNAVERNKGKMKDWEKFAADVERFIVKYRNKK